MDGLILFCWFGGRAARRPEYRLGWRGFPEQSAIENLYADGTVTGLRDIEEVGV